MHSQANMAMSEVVLRPGRERSVLRRHPWVFSGAIGHVHGAPEPGETIDVTSSKGVWLARGAYSPSSQIRVRLWSWDPNVPVDADFFRQRLAQSFDRRRRLAEDPATNVYREVHAESDGLPGLIVDRYDACRVTQFLSAGAERWRPVILQALQDLSGAPCIYDRSDAAVRQLEGLPPAQGPLHGEAPAGPIRVLENDLPFWVDIVQGQKTGFYLDQRESRANLRRTLDLGDVLNAFAYTGAFSVAALAGGASSVLSIEESRPAIELGRRNLSLSGYERESVTWIEGDVFEELRRQRDRRGSFDTIILDPPRFAGSAAQVERAARGYKDINLLAFKLLRPGGRLFTFSCSGAISPELFQKIVADAALDAGVDARVLQWLGQPEDHPVLLSFPESRYLKGLVCRLGGAPSA
jgi:23S rRNA (cytosine1962-C5)-methyltransferase